MLQSFLYRAARIVMDTGMHARGWSREQTIRYFTDTVGLDPISATSEVERYVVWPGQACAYKIGHNEISAFARRRGSGSATGSTSRLSTIWCCSAATCRSRCWREWRGSGTAAGSPDPSARTR